MLYVGGHFNLAGPNCKPGNTAPCSTRHHVAAFDTTDNTLSLNPGANSEHGLLAIANGGTRVAFGGYFTRMGGTNQKGFRSTRPRTCRSRVVTSIVIALAKSLNLKMTKTRRLSARASVTPA